MHVPWPTHWPERRNPTIICDMADGPCACGAWHTLEEFREHVLNHGVSMVLQLEFKLGKMYSVPYADTVIHGILEEVKIMDQELMFRIKRPVGSVWVHQTLPRLSFGDASGTPSLQPG